MNTIDTLKLALEALEKISRTQYHIETPPVESLEEKMRRIADKAITAIKQALNTATPLAAPVQEPYGYWWIPDGSVSGLKPEMSPNTGPHPNFTVIPLYTTPPAQPAPVQEFVHQEWKLVPVNPTNEMIDAGNDVEDLYRRGTPETWGKVYRAMIRAVPAAQPAPKKGQP